MSKFETYPIPRSALLFMAAVEEARRTNEGPFRAIAPIFFVALEPQRGQLLNVAEAAAVLNPILGENFTEHVLAAFLPHLVRLGWLIEEQAGETQAAYRVPTSLPNIQKQEATEASLAKLERLYEAFQNFLEMNAPLLKLTLTSQEFQWQLFRWATSLDGSDKDAIRAEAERLAAGGQLSLKNASLDEPQRFSRIDKSLSVEFAGFTKWLAKHGRPEIADIVSLTELGLAAEFLEEMRRPTAQQDTKLDTVFVLDAPILLDLLGLSGPSRKTSIERCLYVLRDHGGKLVTLAHCLEELSDILKSLLDRPEHRRYGLTGDALRLDPRLVARAREVAHQPDKAAKLAGVDMLVFDLRNPLGANCFPEELVDRFRNSATWHEPYKIEQRERDALSIAFVMRRRQGHYRSDVLDTRFVLVARNSTFTQFAEIFVRKNIGVPNYAFGPAIETKTLAALAWMRFGSAAATDFPQLHLIGACDRILATNGELLRRAEKRLNALKGEETAAILLSSQQAVLDLVIAVGGSPDVLDAANSDELLRAFTTSAEERGRTEERRKADEEQARLEDKIAERDAQLRELEDKKRELATKGLSTEAELRKHAAAIRAQAEADISRVNGIADLIVYRAESWSWRFVCAIWLVCVLVALAGQLFVWQGRGWWVDSWANLIWGSFIIFCSVIAGVFSVRLFAKGKLDLPAAIQTRLMPHFIRFRLKRVEPKEEMSRVDKVLRARKIL